MSTRALAHVYDENDKVLVTIYKHWDGYPDGFCDEEPGWQYNDVS